MFSANGLASQVPYATSGGGHGPGSSGNGGSGKGSQRYNSHSSSAGGGGGGHRNNLRMKRNNHTGGLQPQMMPGNNGGPVDQPHMASHRSGVSIL